MRKKEAAAAASQGGKVTQVAWLASGFYIQYPASNSTWEKLDITLDNIVWCWIVQWWGPAGRWGIYITKYKSQPHLGNM